MVTKTDIADLRAALLGPVASKRHQAASKLKKLPDRAAMPLLKKAMGHWDRRLVQLCAKELVRRTGSKATKAILRANEAGTLSTVATLELIKDCDCPAAFKFASRHRYADREDWRSKANVALKKFRCEPAILSRWMSGRKLTPTIKAQLDTVSGAAISKALLSLDINDAVAPLENRPTREYLVQRGLSALYDRVDGPAGAFLRLFSNPRINKADQAVLSSMPKEAFRKYVKKLYSWSLLPLWHKKPFRDLVIHHGLVEEFPIFLKAFRKEERTKDIAKLAKKLSVETRCLGRLCADWNRMESRYTSTEVPKKSGGKRTITAPDFLLKTVQRAIYGQVLAKQKLHAACHGFRKKKSTATNAAPHRKQEIVINLDLKDFFPSISGGRVYGLFLKLGFNENQSRLLTRLTTYENALPQGAPTSPAIANLVARRLDSRLAGLAKKANLRYTRYADDLTFSGDASAVSLLPSIRKIISEEGFQVARQKTHISRRGARQDVTGLTVNEVVSVPRYFRRRLRAVLHRIENGLSATWNDREVTANTLSGLAAYIRPFHPELAGQCRDAIGNL